MQLLHKDVFRLALRLLGFLFSCVLPLCLEALCPLAEFIYCVAEGLA